MTEAELQAEVIRLAAEHGVLVFHSTDSRRDIGRGFPDLVLVGSRNVMFVELKTTVGHTTPEQTTWRWKLLAAGAYWALWRPKDLPHIPSVLANLLPGRYIRSCERA